MTVDLIPKDPLTRKLLAKVLAKMIQQDFERARARGIIINQPGTTDDPGNADDEEHWQADQWAEEQG